MVEKIDVEEWMEARETADAKIREAVEDGISLGSDFHPTGSKPDPEPAAITPLERYGIESIVDHVIDYYRQVDDTNLDHVADLAKFISETFARDELLRKLLGAWMLEYTVADDGLPDGILGRHVDEAIDQLMPYARRNRLWMQNVLEVE